MTASHTAVKAFYFSKSRQDSCLCCLTPCGGWCHFRLKKGWIELLINSIGNMYWILFGWWPFLPSATTLGHNGVVKYVLESHFNFLIPSISRTKSWSINYWNVHEISCKIAGVWKCKCDLISNLTPLWTPKLGRSLNILSAKQLEFVKEWVMKSSKILFTLQISPIEHDVM